MHAAKQCPLRRLFIVATLSTCTGGVLLYAATAIADHEKSPAEIRTQLPDVVRQLDSADYGVRHRAAATMERWLALPAVKAILAEEFQRRLMDPQTSFEVRYQLERWSRRLPKISLPPEDGASVEELERLVRLADDDSYAVREGAKRRIQWWLEKPALAGPVLVRLKQQLRDPALRPEQRAYLEPLLEEARGAWLRNDPDGSQTPPLSNAELTRWIDQLEQAPPGPANVPWPGHAQAERELLDALARDDQVPRIKILLEQRLAKQTERDAAQRLRAVLDWTHPELVAEIWEERHLRTEQHLLVGVPTRAEGAPAPSHFDRIDDRLAHCVSGATLSKGNYPAMEAFPHPHKQSLFFYLVNLPTPRRRLAYSYDVQRDETVRLIEISRRTLERWLERKQTANFREAVMLRLLDPKELSRFAGRYFLLVDDARLAIDDEEPREQIVSRHTILCSFLMYEGTREAIPGLLAAIEQKRFLPPGTRPPYNTAWCAALAIARRDPWPEVDAWLAGLLARSEDLVVGHGESPQLGATAAGILLSRYEQDPEAFGLESTGPLAGRQSKLTGYRGTAESAEKIAVWWKAQSSKGIKLSAASDSLKQR